ncbi:MAG TPA: hypothetical protein VGK73_27310 [Polyangiaceae bacterium]
MSIETIGVFNSGESVVLPAPPSYTARIGLSDSSEIGLHFSHMTSLGADFKWNPIKGEVFDLALDPGGNVGFIASSAGSAFLYYAQLPVLLDFNFSESVTMVLSPGMGIYGATGGTNADFAYSDTAPLFRGGVGFDFRTSKKFAVHPEVSILIPFKEGYGTIFLGGIGFNFGTLPDFG